MKQETKNVWLPVRKSGDDGHEFVLLSEIGYSRKDAFLTSVHTNEIGYPSYAKENPVVRIARVDVTITERD